MKINCLSSSGIHLPLIDSCPFELLDSRRLDDQSLTALDMALFVPNRKEHGDNAQRHGIEFAHLPCVLVPQVDLLAGEFKHSALLLRRELFQTLLGPMPVRSWCPVCRKDTSR